MSTIGHGHGGGGHGGHHGGHPGGGPVWWGNEVDLVDVDLDDFDFSDDGEVIVRPRVVLGDDTFNNDKATVKKVQQQLHALAASLNFVDLETYTSSFKDDGVMGSMTKHAVGVFNKTFGWPADGENITAGTVDALKRVTDMGPAAALAHIAEMNTAAASTPQQVQAAATQVAQAASSPSMPAAVKVEVAQAQAKAAAAVTPAQVQSAKEDLQRAAEKVKKAAEPSFFMAMHAGIPTWGWMLGGVGVAMGLFFSGRALLHRKRK